MDYYQIGKRIREERTKQALTQEQLAEKAGISTNFLACIESGNRHGSFDTYAKLVKALNTTFDTITQDSIPKAQDDILRKELLLYFNQLDQSDRLLFIRLAAEFYKHKHYNE